MASTKLYEIQDALRMAERVEALEGTNQNAGQTTVQTTYGRSCEGYQRLMDYIAADVQARFMELRDRAIAEARAEYEQAMKTLSEPPE